MKKKNDGKTYFDIPDEDFKRIVLELRDEIGFDKQFTSKWLAEKVHERYVSEIMQNMAANGILIRTPHDEDPLHDTYRLHPNYLDHQLPP